MPFISRPKCSKAPRGLFVLSWVTRIFTGLSISPSPVFLLNSRLSLSFAASSPHGTPVMLLRHPFFRRYGVILPSSLTEGRSITLGYLSLPTCVGLRYGRNSISLEAFLGGLGTN